MDTLPLKTLTTLLRVIVDQGYPVERALNHIDFNPLLGDRHHRQEIPSASYSKLYRLLMALLQDEAYGLTRRDQSPPGTFRMMCLYVINCSTLEQALIRSWEFHDYCDQYRAENTPAGAPFVSLMDTDQVLCSFQRGHHHETAENLADNANMLLMMVRFYSWLIGKDLPLQRVKLRANAPDSTAQYEGLFNCPVDFQQQHSGLVLQRSTLQSAVAQDEDSLQQYLLQTPYQLTQRNRHGSDNSLSQKIEQLLTVYATQKLPTADLVADKLNMSPRTLHRKLTAEHTSFQQLKDDYRKDLAINYVSRPELTIDDIAALMNFQDNSAFYRSFKKWTGTSPGQYRGRAKKNQVLYV